jgi:hypothetical protein
MSMLKSPDAYDDNKQPPANCERTTRRVLTASHRVLLLRVPPLSRIQQLQTTGSASETPAELDLPTTCICTRRFR